MEAEQYYPNFCTGFKRGINTFKTLEELLDIEWIKKKKEIKGFYQFSLSIDKNDGYTKRDNPQHTLMAEYDEGREWWVVAFIRNKNIDPIKDRLPKWEPKEE